jgi:hypothetical protein
MGTSSIFLTSCFDRENPPRLDLRGRPGTLSKSAILAWRDANNARFQGSRGRVAMALAMLWHDHWEEAHAVAQSDEGEPEYDLLHAIVHRREGDFSNASYWFRSAGSHPLYETLFSRIDKSANKEDSRLIENVLSNGKWNAPAFVAAVKKNEPEALLRALQAEEIIAFFETLTA